MDVTRRAFLATLTFVQVRPRLHQGVTSLDVTYAGVITHVEAEEKTAYVTFDLHDRNGTFEGHLTVVCDRAHPAMEWLMARKGRDVAGAWADV